MKNLLRWWFWYEPKIDVKKDSTLAQAINTYRVSKKLQPLEISPCLSAQAVDHAHNVESKLQKPHQHFVARVSACGLYNKAGEIVAPWYYTSSEDAIQAWEQSPGHLSLMLGDFRKIGGGAAGGTHVAIFTK